MSWPQSGVRRLGTALLLAAVAAGSLHAEVVSVHLRPRPDKSTLGAEPTTGAAAWRAGVGPLFPTAWHVRAWQAEGLLDHGAAASHGAPETRASDTEPPGRGRRGLAASVALATAGAAVAYWHADHADAAYRRYLRSAGAGRQQRALDRAEHHDRLAGAGFLLMEVGLGLTTWYVFF